MSIQKLFLKTLKKYWKNHPKTRNAKGATARVAGDLRHKLARDRVTLEYEEIRAQGPRICDNNYYNDVQKKLVSGLFLSLGMEGKKK